VGMVHRIGVDITDSHPACLERRMILVDSQPLLLSTRLRRMATTFGTYSYFEAPIRSSRT